MNPCKVHVYVRDGNRMVNIKKPWKNNFIHYRCLLCPTTRSFSIHRSARRPDERVVTLQPLGTNWENIPPRYE